MSGYDYYSQGSRPIASISNAYRPQYSSSASTPPPPPFAHHARSDPTGGAYASNLQSFQPQPPYQRSQSMTGGLQGGPGENTRWPARPPPSWVPQQHPPTLTPPPLRPSWAPSGPFGLSSAPMVPYAGQPLSASLPTSFPTPHVHRPVVPPKVPSIHHRHSISGSSNEHRYQRSSVAEEEEEEEAFPKEKRGSLGTASVKPTISIVSTTGEQIELDEDQALALAIERSLKSDFSNRSTGVTLEEGDVVPQMSRRSSRPNRESLSGNGSRASPRFPVRPDLSVSIPSSTATSSRSSTYRQSAVSAIAQSEHGSISANPLTSLSQRSHQNPVVNFDDDVVSTSLPSVMQVPAAPYAFEITGPSFNHLLKKLIAQANVRLEPCPTAFETSNQDQPTFTLSCKIKAFLPNPPPPSSATPESRRNMVGKDGLHKTVLHLQVVEKGPGIPSSRPSVDDSAIPPNRTSVETETDISTAPLASKVDPHSVQVDFDNNLVLPLTMDVLVERLYSMLKFGQAEAKRASNQPMTDEEITALALFKFVSLHPGPAEEELPVKFRKQNKVSPPSPPPMDGEKVHEATELTGKEKKMGKRFMVRNLTSKVVGALQGHRHDVQDEEREDWITPFRTDDDGA